MCKTHLQSKRSALTTILILIFNQALCVDAKNILDKKSLLRLITETNILKNVGVSWLGFEHPFSAFDPTLQPTATPPRLTFIK